ncbi:unnamed protein product [Clonostachys rhizophaga]|uniref:Uncharacterized protein n=1 Tax=Clonostachys rhizophaga TaxID=160324 RepID=A0A9N9YL71_9HYPO|nr:unnamed protein product [Clonostachys rhizophaga]
MPPERRRKTKATDNIPRSGDPERQRQREKVAALEAQAKIKELPEPLSQGQEVSRLEGHSELVSRICSTSPPNVAIEEMVRSPGGFDLPEPDFRQESLDMSPLQYFGE